MYISIVLVTVRTGQWSYFAISEEPLNTMNMPIHIVDTFW